jgi:hypothetical protein
MVPYERWQFDLQECKVNINIIKSDRKGKGFATAFLNLKLPDGRWITFEIVEADRVPLYKEAAEG